MPAWLLPAASALIGGVTNLFSASAAEEAEKRRQKAALAMLERSIIDDAELSSLLRKQTKLFNVGLQNTLNTTALRSRSLANPGVVGAAASGQIEGAKAATLAETEMNVLEQNANTRSQQASILNSGSAVADPVGSFFGGAVAGGIAGVRAMNLFEMDRPDASVDPSSGTTNGPEGAVPGLDVAFSDKTQQLISNAQSWQPYSSWKYF